jgi:hypothetical protein
MNTTTETPAKELTTVTVSNATSTIANPLRPTTSSRRTSRCTLQSFTIEMAIPPYGIDISCPIHGHHIILRTGVTC